MNTINRRMAWACLTVVALGSAAPAWATGPWYVMARYAIAAEYESARPEQPWLTDLSLRDRPTNITMADGAEIMQRPGMVSSRYDTSVRRDVSEFYAASYPRFNAMAHYAGRRAGEVFSFGVDSGFSADKIHVRPALFFGYTRALPLAKHTHLAVSAGGWIGGAVSEEPCRDSYQREYYCPTLTAWRDHPPAESRLERYLGMLLIHAF